MVRGIICRYRIEKTIYEKGASAIMCSRSALTLADLPDAIDDAKKAAQEVGSSGEAIQDAFLQLYQGQAAALRGTNGDRTAGDGADAFSTGTGIADAYLQHYHEQRIWERARESAESTQKRAESFTRKARAVNESRGTMLVEATDAILLSVTEQLNTAKLDPDGGVNALRSTATSFTKGLRDTFEQLREAAGVAKKASEDAKQAANDKRSNAAAHAQIATPNTPQSQEAKKTHDTAADAANTANKSTRKADEAVSSAARILEIVNLKSTCGAQL